MSERERESERLVERWQVVIDMNNQHESVRSRLCYALLTMRCVPSSVRGPVNSISSALASSTPVCWYNEIQKENIGTTTSVSVSIQSNPVNQMVNDNCIQGINQPINTNQLHSCDTQSKQAMCILPWTKNRHPPQRGKSTGSCQARTS